MQIHKTMVAAAIVATGLLYGTPGQAASTSGGFLDSVNQAIGSVWDFISSPFPSAGGGVEPPSPMRYLHGMKSKEASSFWGHLKHAGYELKEVSTVIGLIPGVSFEFLLVRELTEADRDSLERKLEIAEELNPGLIPAIQRQIVRTLLEASDLKEMRIAELTVALLPLPSAEFKLEPIEVPLGEGHDVIYRAVQDLKKMKK